MAKPKFTADKNEATASRGLQVDIFLLVLVLLATFTVGSTIWVRAHLISPGFTAQPDPHGWQITKIVRDDTNGGLPKAWLGRTIDRVCSVTGTTNCVSLDPIWMSDSLTMPTRSGMLQFIVGQQALLALAPLAGEQVLVYATESHIFPNNTTPVVVTLNGSHEFLDERFILMLTAAILVYTVGCAMLAFVRRTHEVWTAFAMCAGFFFFMLARAWYTNRSWAQPEVGWWCAIAVFRISVLVCGTASVLSLWKLRLHGQKIWIPVGASALIGGIVTLHSTGFIESTSWGYRYPTLGFLIVTVYIGFHAWRSRQRATPGERLRTKTADIILLMGFVPLFITMPIWTFRPDLQQISYLQNIALGLAGIPALILVSRSARYQLHAFWWRLWLVLMAAVLALVSAIVIVLIFGASAGLSLAVMLLAAGGVIYTLRGWLEKRLIGAPPSIEQFLPQIMQMQGLQGDALEQSWRAILIHAFYPQSIQPLPAAPDIANLQTQGESLLLPALGTVPALILTGAAQYTRSFGPADLRLATSLHALLAQGLQARNSFVAGATQERRRIAADLHDDIGGKLLHLAGIGGTEGAYARNTLEDLRTITRGLSAQPRPLDELLADIQFQLAQRAERADLAINCKMQLPPELPTCIVGSRQSTLLASICSELMRNAMQHTGAQRIAFDFSVKNGVAALTCSNDGNFTDPKKWAHGLGTTSISRRIHDLQGQCRWQSKPEGGVIFTAQWSMLTWLNDMNIREDFSEH